MAPRQTASHRALFSPSECKFQTKLLISVKFSACLLGISSNMGKLGSRELSDRTKWLGNSGGAPPLVRVVKGHSQALFTF